jgi:hypothetical protein
MAAHHPGPAVHGEVRPVPAHQRLQQRLQVPIFMDLRPGQNFFPKKIALNFGQVSTRKQHSSENHFARKTICAENHFPQTITLRGKQLSVENNLRGKQFARKTICAENNLRGKQFARKTICAENHSPRKKTR